MASGFILWPILLVSISVSAVEPIPLYNLFTNAVIRAQYLHQLAADIYKEFERSLPPDAHRQLSKISPLAGCYSDSIPTPTGKDETQEKSDGYLLRISSALIQSWVYPLKTLSKAFSNSLMFGTSDGIFEKLEDLSEGINELMRVVGDGGVHMDELRRLTYENFDVILRNDAALMKNYGLLACFKKDMHKVETYLKVTKCRRFVESNCTL
ncbi:somatotropin [Megalops cyprinoides]|uniref:somatotropin n=1 Tax=Megalops cyprinoides TaxID=118141 RepID=UPI00186467B2|nr:somatotropin [Megalops cyprinoides]